MPILRLVAASALFCQVTGVLKRNVLGSEDLVNMDGATGDRAFPWSKKKKQPPGPSRSPSKKDDVVKTEPTEAPKTESVKKSAGSPDKKNRQQLQNFADLQYYASINVGGQQITGIIDTGSFDLVVFDSSCSGCGRAAAYASSKSATFKPGTLVQTLNFGSGSVTTTEAFDYVAIGPYDKANLSFWNSYSASMPVLRNARFQSIIGVGPPETSAADAWSLVKHSLNSITADISVGELPTKSQEKSLADKVELSFELSLTKRLVQVDNVSMFSVCLGYKPGSAGYFVWGDDSPTRDPSAFKYIPVLGIHTWTVNMTNVALTPKTGSPLSIGCEAPRGCGTIVDSGTSLLLMPSSVVSRLLALLQNDDRTWDCNDISSLPTLTFELGDYELTLPPDAYIGQLNDDLPAQMSAFVGKRQLRDCQLAIMESYAETNWGPLWILGMPFFRKYYTTFKFGSNHSDRAIMVAEASPDCTPNTAEVSLAKESAVMRSYNMSDMFLSSNVYKALQSGSDIVL